MKPLAPNLILLFSLVGTVALGQVNVDAPIILNGVEPEQRQLTGLDDLELPGALQTAGTEGSGAFRTALPAPGPVWAITLPGLSTEPVAGMHVIVKCPSPIAGSLTIQINGHGPYAVLLGPDQAAEGQNFSEGMMLSLVFDGEHLQVMNGAVHAPRTCPPDMVAVNDQFCIETNERLNQTFYEASVICAAADRRLCRWGELYAACLRQNELEILNIQNGTEWTNSTADSNYQVRTIGLAIGNCTSANRSHANNFSFRFRCCSTR